VCYISSSLRWSIFIILLESTLSLLYQNLCAFSPYCGQSSLLVLQGQLPIGLLLTCSLLTSSKKMPEFGPPLAP